MVCPRISGDFDYEGELAVIIGRPGRHIAKSDALSHVFGYTCFNDGSIRDISVQALDCRREELLRDRRLWAVDRYCRRDPGSDPACTW
jgi:2-keto-4-pentenoate hydratase/2-oxohepta-3-ene-1,7-dioic acid hydratase in catechol pathway